MNWFLRRVLGDATEWLDTRWAARFGFQLERALAKPPFEPVHYSSIHILVGVQHPRPHAPSSEVVIGLGDQHPYVVIAKRLSHGISVTIEKKVAKGQWTQLKDKLFRPDATAVDIAEWVIHVLTDFDYDYMESLRMAFDPHGLDVLYDHDIEFVERWSADADILYIEVVDDQLAHHLESCGLPFRYEVVAGTGDTALRIGHEDGTEEVVAEVAEGMRSLHEDLAHWAKDPIVNQLKHTSG